MDDAHDEQRPRASIKGKGREILLGQHASTDDVPPDSGKTTLPRSPKDAVDGSALALTPEETQALRDLSAAPPADDARLTFSADEPDEMYFEPEPLLDDSPPDWVDEPAEDSPSALEGDAEASQEAVPLAERMPDLPVQSFDAPYDPKPEADELIPGAPESWSEVEKIDPHVEPGRPFQSAPVSAKRVPEEDHDGGLVWPEGAVAEEEDTDDVHDPFRPVVRRQPSDALFPPTEKPDKSLLETLVTDEELKQLWEQINALQEELIREVQGDRGTTDVYQQELLRASALLLESRANYDDARAIVYRIRADLNRQRKVTADVMRYRPLLLNYYLGWGIAWVVLFALKSLFTGVADAVGIDIVSAIYHPILFGVLGALISGYLTLERHTTRLRDFDPIYISWYLFNPLLGGVMGLLMFLLYALANQDVLHESATRLEVAIAWILCVLAGMNQNTVLRQMNDLLKRVSRSSRT